MPSSIPTHSPDSCSGEASATTLECLRSAMRLTYPRWQAIVVDNGSQGDEAAVIEVNFPAVRVIREVRCLEEARVA